MNFTSSSNSSTATLVPTKGSSSNSNTAAPTKNYEQAFGQLSSSFGFGGTVPVSTPIIPSSQSPQQRTEAQAQVPTSTSSTSTSNPSASASASASTSGNATAQYSQQSMTAYWQTQSSKNFEAAVGDLASTYGFNGNIPSPSPKKISRRNN